MQGAASVWRFDSENSRVKTIQPLPQKETPKLRFNWNAPMAVSTNQPNRFYMGSQFLHKSEDMGDTWQIISPDLTTNDPKKQEQENSGGLSKDNSGAENHTTIFTIAESSLDEKVIWVGTDDGNVQVTKDGGKTWVNTTPNIKGLPLNTWCYHIEASVHNKQTAYAVFDGHVSGDMKAYVFKTADYGKTWSSIATDEIEIFARNIQEDFKNPDLLFLGTELGLYITINGGKKWSKFTNKVPPVAIHFIALQKQTNDLVLGTHGRGVIIIDDISPLRSLNKEVLSKKLHFFDSDVFYMSDKSGSFGNGFGAETQFVGDNPSSAAQIKYVLPKRHTFGKMSMEIQNMDGEKISSLSPGKSKGINIVNWSYNMKQPKVAKAKTFAFGGFASPRMPAGKYKAVINKGKASFEHVFEIAYDKESKLNASEIKTKNQTIMKLYNMTEELAYIIYKMDTLIDITSKTRVKSSLIKLKETLVVTTGDNYVGSAEPQLREKIVELYSKLVSSYDQPSSAELEYLGVIESNFLKAKKDLEKLFKKAKAKNIQFLSFEDFIK